MDRPDTRCHRGGSIRQRSARRLRAFAVIVGGGAACRVRLRRAREKDRPAARRSPEGQVRHRPMCLTQRRALASPPRLRAFGAAFDASGEFSSSAVLSALSAVTNRDLCDSYRCADGPAFWHGLCDSAPAERRSAQADRSAGAGRALFLNCSPGCGGRPSEYSRVKPLQAASLIMNTSTWEGIQVAH